MAENEEQENNVGVVGLDNLKDEPQDAQPTPAEEVSTTPPTDPHPADENPEEHIGDEEPDPWAEWAEKVSKGHFEVDDSPGVKPIDGGDEK